MRWTYQNRLKKEIEEYLRGKPELKIRHADTKVEDRRTISGLAITGFIPKQGPPPSRSPRT